MCLTQPTSKSRAFPLVSVDPLPSQSARSARSESLEERLSTGAVIQEISLHGDRLHFRTAFFAMEYVEYVWYWLEVWDHELMERELCQLCCFPTSFSVPQAEHGSTNGSDNWMQWDDYENDQPWEVCAFCSQCCESWASSNVEKLEGHEPVNLWASLSQLSFWLIWL